MWWHSNGWWWWWIAFVVIFFLIPLGYGWGYRGWGPWYRRRHPSGIPRSAAPPPDIEGDNLRRTPADNETESGWGAAAVFLWLVLILAIIWLIAAWGWGGRW